MIKVISNDKEVFYGNMEVSKCRFHLLLPYKLIGTNGINTQADLAKHLGVSRARVTQALNLVGLND